MKAVKLTHLETREEFYKGLKTVPGYSFPMICPSCKKVYEDVEKFIDMTVPVADIGGFIVSDDSAHGKILESLRACECGQVMAEEFYSRRDDSEVGERRRELFDQLLMSLLNVGLTKDEARLELIGYFNTGESRLLERLGLIK